MRKISLNWKSIVKRNNENYFTNDKKSKRLQHNIFNSMKTIFDLSVLSNELRFNQTVNVAMDWCMYSDVIYR